MWPLGLREALDLSARGRADEQAGRWTHNEFPSLLPCSIRRDPRYVGPAVPALRAFLLSLFVPKVSLYLSTAYCHLDGAQRDLRRALCWGRSAGST